MFETYKKKIAIKALEYGIKNYPDYFIKKVQDAASIAAKQMTMQYLGQSGYLHCSVCPRTGTLRRFNGHLFCHVHYSPIQKEKNLANKQEALKS